MREEHVGKVLEKGDYVAQRDERGRGREIEIEREREREIERESTP